jgi:hypothetical protein
MTYIQGVQLKSGPLNNPQYVAVFLVTLLQGTRGSNVNRNTATYWG